VQPVGVVDVLDEGADAGASVVEIGIGSPVDLMDASFSEAVTLSRGAARLRRRAHRASRDARLSTGYGGALGSLSASEVLASMRSTVALAETRELRQERPARRIALDQCAGEPQR
jgi:hypothetical protein